MVNLLTAMSHLRNSNLPLMWLSAAAVLVAGCGPAEVLGRVSGKVTFQGEPVERGMILFQNEEKGVFMTADLETDGSYEVDMARGKGLPLGIYRVSLSPPLPDPSERRCPWVGTV